MTLWRALGNTFDGVGVAYAGPNLYSILSLIRAYLDVTLTDQFDLPV
jgi:hypothetical protein